MKSVSAQDEDRTARARIRDAALEQFAEHGAQGTSVKAIAAQVGVSPALVFHHFGSKAGLRAECDAHVVAVISEQKRRALQQGPQLDLLGALAQQAQGPPALAYLGRMLSDGSEQARALVDDMVEMSEGLLAQGVASGAFEPVERPRDLSVVLVLWSLGMLTLRDHAERLLGGDITGDADARARYVRAAVEALRGLFTEGLYEHARDVATDMDVNRAREGRR